MRTSFLLTVILALLATWAAAQSQNNPPAENSATATVRGCLTGAVHQYRLVDEKRVVYEVAGNDKQLSGFDGQEVEITGKVEERIPPKEKQTASSFSRPEHRLTVTSITKVSDTCTGASE